MFKALQFLCSQETEKWKKDSKSQFPGRNGLFFFSMLQTSRRQVDKSSYHKDAVS